MYKVEFCLLLWPFDLLSFDALLYFYDNKYVVILILIPMKKMFLKISCGMRMSYCPTEI